MSAQTAGGPSDALTNRLIACYGYAKSVMLSGAKHLNGCVHRGREQSPSASVGRDFRPFASLRVTRPGRVPVTLCMLNTGHAKYVGGHSTTDEECWAHRERTASNHERTGAFAHRGRTLGGRRHCRRSPSINQLLPVISLQAVAPIDSLPHPLKLTNLWNNLAIRWRTTQPGSWWPAASVLSFKVF